jgi:hypothetical protein
MAMAGLNAWGKEARDRLGLEKMRDAGDLVVDHAETVEPHGLDGMAGGHHPHGRVWRRRLLHDRGDAACFQHACDETQVLAALRAVRLRLGRDGRARRVSHSLLLGRGNGRDPQKLFNDT